MELQTILFWFFALIAAVASILVIANKKPLISALFLILNFFSLAGIYLLLSAQFIAISQVIVYAGAIMVLFVFVIMLLNAKDEEKFAGGMKKIKNFVYIFGAIIFIELVYFIFGGNNEKISAHPKVSVEIGTIENIGFNLYVYYILPFIVASFLLLVATIGSILLAKKKIEQSNE
jgi:NADH-quinone oxidoreductase subunit J